jgi:hypothetical protein
MQDRLPTTSLTVRPRATTLALLLSSPLFALPMGKETSFDENLYVATTCNVFMWEIRIHLDPKSALLRPCLRFPNPVIANAEREPADRRPSSFSEGAATDVDQHYSPSWFLRIRWLVE